MDKKQRLMEIYRQDPCRTLPNAFWKTAREIETSRLMIQRNAEGELRSLAVWQGSRLMALWCANPDSHPLTADELAEVSFALVHDGSLPIFSARQFKAKAYFRILHKGGLPDYDCPPGFVIEAVQPTEDAAAVAQMIQSCYEEIQVSAEIVKRWKVHPVFDPNLWVWIVEQETGIRVGLGIAEIDLRIPEASLEWIQVIPVYRGRGLGKALVVELLRRVAGRIAFTTVAGEVDNVTLPEHLYRRCGFSGSDIWWLLESQGDP